MRKQYFGKFDYQLSPILFDPPEIADSAGSSWNKGFVTVDGRTIEHVWYADTEAGILKTYAVVNGTPQPTIGVASYLAPEKLRRTLERCA